MQSITINARKFDGKIHRSWQAELIEQRSSLLIFVGEFAEEVKHPNLGVIRRGTLSYEYYWLNRWYNVFRFHHPNGELRNFYCNINMPPVFENQSLDYVDFDIDVLIWNDFSHEILDLEEFKENTVKYRYPPKVIEKVYQSLDEILRLLKNRKFPFATEIIPK